MDLTQPNPFKILLLDDLETPQHLKIIDNHLYFSEFDAGKISRINLSQFNPEPEVVLSNLDGPTGIEFYDNCLIFSVYGANKISKLPNLLSSINSIENIPLTVYPNPVSDILIIKNLPTQKTLVRLYDANVALVRQDVFAIEGQMQVTGLPAGNYYLSIDNSLAVQKIVIID